MRIKYKYHEQTSSAEMTVTETRGMTLEDIARGLIDYVSMVVPANGLHIDIERVGGLFVRSEDMPIGQYASVWPENRDFFGKDRRNFGVALRTDFDDAELIRHLRVVMSRERRCLKAVA